MRRLAALGLRARLALAVVGASVLAVSLATVLGNLGLEPRLNDAARTRLASSAAHAADLAAMGYAREGAFTPSTRQALAHAAALGGLRLQIESGGRVITAGPQPSGYTARAPVRVGGSLLTPDEQHLRHSLDRLHLIAGAVAILAALLIAVLVAETLSRPWRRIRRVAERLERGELDARVAVGGDSETQAVARPLNRLAETLEHAEEVRKAGVADLAHELRTPVNGLLTRIEAAQDGVLEGPANLASMHAEALRLTRLLDDLATLADAERPGLLRDKGPLDLAEVGRAVADSFRPRFADRDIAFVVDLEPAFVVGDRGRLEQIAGNLLANALRYTESGTVALRSGRDGELAFLEVADTGIGVAADEVRHLFTRFWRSDRSRSRVTGGSGIGLAVVRELVRAHDGHIEVDSSIGQGSRFRVAIPLAERLVRR